MIAETVGESTNPRGGPGRCFRCRKPLGNRWCNFLDRKYHDPVCYTIMLVRYKELRGPMAFDSLSISEINALLSHLQYDDPAIGE